ncbi:MAG TPA: TOMM precursor leader peptide-binding protein [Gemmataceae bacterium]
MSGAHRRPRLALPFTILTGRDTVQLVAGEDFRYTLTGSGLEDWLAGWLAGLDGRTSLEETLGRLPETHRQSTRQLVDRLYGERILIDGCAADAHIAVRWRSVPTGSAAWAAGWSPTTQDTADRILPILCQDRLDYDEALRFNRRCLETGTPWLWASTGPMSRAYLSPLFLADAGPCLSCLLYHFRRLSPTPELYDGLVAHAQAGHPIAPVPVPPAGLAVLRQLILWKVALAEERDASAALYRLHVLEVASLEVTAHRVFIDPECPECGGRN